MRILRSWRFWLGLAISGLCLWLALKDVPLAELQGVLATARYAWLAPAVVVQLLAVLTRALRWQAILDRRGILAETFWGHCVGFLFTNLLPFRAGDPARALVVAEKSGIPFLQVGGSVIVERVIDVATVLLALVLLLPWMQVPQIVRQAGIVFGLVVILALAGLWVMVHFREPATARLRSMLAQVKRLPAERLLGWLDQLLDGFAPLTRPFVALSVLTWSVLSWGLSIAIYWCVLHAFQPNASWVEAGFMVVSLSLAISVPSSPGFIGVFQYVGQQALVLPFGAKYDAGTALAATLTAHLVYYLITTGLGIAGLWRFGETLSGLGRRIGPRPPSSPPAVAANPD
jgi:uncharacterized protein (TIRG00374 family)